MQSKLSSITLFRSLRQQRVSFYSTKNPLFINYQELKAYNGSNNVYFKLIEHSQNATYFKVEVDPPSSSVEQSKLKMSVPPSNSIAEKK